MTLFTFSLTTLGLLVGFTALGAASPAPAKGDALHAKTPNAKKAAKTYRVYMGTYTGEKSKGIYLYQMDAATGKLTPEGLVAETASPSFLAIHPNHRFLYAVNELGEYQGKVSGAVSAFAIDSKTGHLTPLNQVASGGAAPCHVVVDHSGKNVLVANYSTGSVSVFPIRADGSLGEASTFIEYKPDADEAQRKAVSHGHYINVDSANQFVYVADAGFDKVYVYHFDAAKGTLVPNEPAFASLPLLSGPRHLAFHPNGQNLYVIDETNSTVTVFDYAPKAGTLKAKQTISTLPDDFKGGNTTAEIGMTPDGKFLYGSNRGSDSLATFSVDPATGLLTRVSNQSTLGKTPRNFAIDPTGKFLLAANQDSDNVVVFHLDAKTGKLTPTGQTLDVGKPVCVLITPVP